ncbi:hypothetical protein GJ744_008791 [Endocarpon pusillum]|uniref:F-box domain-containing protein n=1 Tax=Endocarpon pusillum TaxID=364733 RepID=A0A8H7ASG9_9EURO|nr:hypothetical protein GJ744_008791 [Endocarpon pusillum]
MSLMSLPTEIHYHLQKFLDHPSLLSLSATNKYFESLSSKKEVEDSLLTFEKCSLIVHTVLTKNKLLPCYICLKGLPASDHFPPLPGDKDDELGNNNMGIRACATCIIATKPDALTTYGVQPSDDWAFRPGHYAGPGNCKLYTSRHGTLRRQTGDWLHCPKCHFIKRYASSPWGRRRKIDEAMLIGDMCPQCYQPVWDQENEENRLRRNARDRARRRLKKMRAEKEKEAERKRQQANSGTAASAMTPTTAVAVTPMTTAATPMTSAGMVVNTQMPLSSRLSMPAPLQIPTYMPQPHLDGTATTDQDIDSGFMDAVEDLVSSSSFDMGSAWDINQQVGERA